MPGTVTVIRDAANGREFMNDGGYRMYLYSESGRYSFQVDVAPRKIEYGGLGLDWAQAERSGQAPLLLHKGQPLDTMAFEFMITDKMTMLAPQGARVAQLRTMMRVNERILVKYSTAEMGMWRITEASFSSELRAEDDEVARGTVSVTLTRASDAAPAVGPVLRPPPPPPPPPNPPPPRTYVVVKGDCLWNIARKFYGPNAGPSWPRIYDANRGQIKDPHWIYPGQRFVIP